MSDEEIDLKQLANMLDYAGKLIKDAQRDHEHEREKLCLVGETVDQVSQTIRIGFL